MYIVRGVGTSQFGLAMACQFFLVANPTIKYFTRFIYLVIKTLSFAQAFVNGVCVCMTESANVFANSSQCCHTAMQALFSRKGMIHSI